MQSKLGDKLNLRLNADTILVLHHINLNLVNADSAESFPQKLTPIIAAICVGVCQSEENNLDVIKLDGPMTCRFSPPTCALNWETRIKVSGRISFLTLSSPMTPIMWIHAGHNWV